MLHLNLLTRIVLFIIIALSAAAPSSKFIFDGVFKLSEESARNEQNSPCVNVLQHLSNYFLTDSDALLHVIRNSGHDYNDFGRYRDCHQIHAMNYYMLAILDKFPVPLAVGLCLPKECTLSDVEEFKPTLLKGIKAVLPNMMEQVKGLDTINYQITIEDLIVVDPKVENAKVTKFTRGSLFTITLMCIFAMTVILSTLVVWKQRQDQIHLQDMNGQDENIHSSNGRPIPLFAQSSSSKFLSCFDLVENLQILNKPLAKQGDEELEVLNFVRVACCVMIIFGNTYFFMMKSPIQNLESLQDWISSRYFSFIISADLFVDAFFWLGAFLASYQLLMRMSINEGRLPSSKIKLYLCRMMRLWPLYIFTLLFFWRFMVLLGGEGPMFFQYDEHAKCGSSFIWHLLFLNNIIPWGSRDSCMQWTWYLACDVQFFMLVPLLIAIYYHSRKKFWISIGLLWFTSALLSAIVIVKNDFSASYFTYKDTYWTVFYEKPWARLPAYLVGIICGCSYYSYKHEQFMQPGPIRQNVQSSPDSDSNLVRDHFEADEREPEPNFVILVYHKIAKSNFAAIGALFIGWAIRYLMVRLLLAINNASGNVSLGLNMLYLLFQRPLFVVGTAISILPFLLRSPILQPITQMMASQVWYPLARLTYGAYLSHGIFMLFRAYNTERGVFACEFDAFLFFFAYLTFAFTFSLIITIMVELPCLRLVDAFIIRSKGSLITRSNIFRSFTTVSSDTKSDTVDHQQDLLDGEEDQLNLLDDLKVKHSVIFFKE